MDGQDETIENPFSQILFGPVDVTFASPAARTVFLAPTAAFAAFTAFAAAAASDEVHAVDV